MVDVTKMICITCPMGCSLEVTHEGETVVNIDGATCKRAETYVKEELTDPRRMVATTVRVKGGIHPLVPVRTAAPVPKGRIFDLLQALREVELEAPVKVDEVVLDNVVDTDVAVLASRDLPRA